MDCSSTTIPKVMFPYAIVHYTVEYTDVQYERADARGVQQDDIHGTVTSVSIRTTVVSHGVRVRTARKSACKYEFVPQYISVYGVVQHEECMHDGVQQYQYT